VLCPSGPGLPQNDRFGAVDVVRFRYAPRALERLAYTGAMHRRARGPYGLLVPSLLAGFRRAAVREGQGADVLPAHWWAPAGLVRAGAGSGGRGGVVGEGDRGDELEALAASSGARVEFTGALAPAELTARYRQARAVVVPSRREGFGIVAAEAAAAGRAVIASAVGGLPDIVRPGVNGVLVPPGDVDALARAIADLD